MCLKITISSFSMNITTKVELHKQHPAQLILKAFNPRSTSCAKPLNKNANNLNAERTIQLTLMTDLLITIIKVMVSRLTMGKIVNLGLVTLVVIIRPEMTTIKIILNNWQVRLRFIIQFGIVSAVKTCSIATR